MVQGAEFFCIFQQQKMKSTLGAVFFFLSSQSPEGHVNFFSGGVKIFFFAYFFFHFSTFLVKKKFRKRLFFLI